ncbi:hypothetical protein Tco_1356187, partial [Tanacetum coccineum]
LLLDANEASSVISNNQSLLSMDSTFIHDDEEELQQDVVTKEIRSSLQKDVGTRNVGCIDFIDEGELPSYSACKNLNRNGVETKKGVRLKEDDIIRYFLDLDVVVALGTLKVGHGMVEPSRDTIVETNGF